MHRSPKLKITELNPHLLCGLCGGYLIDASTLAECLHSFCRSCIIKHLDTHKTCPLCEALIHKTRPQHAVRPDKALQGIVYKLVPGLYHREMQRRQEFYDDRPDHKPNTDEVDLCPDPVFPPSPPPEHERISLALESVTDANLGPCYLLCPPCLTVAQLNKFIRNKFGLPSPRFDVVLMHGDICLATDFTLLEVAQVHAWRRTAPLQVSFAIVDLQEPTEGRRQRRATMSSTTPASSTTSGTSAPSDDEIGRPEGPINGLINACVNGN